MKHIVILGASYAGISTAHRILKQAAKAGQPFKITLVSPNTHFYWNIAAPRGLIPGQFTDEQLFQPISDGFAQYPSNRFEFVLGQAEKLVPEAKKVTISAVSGEKTLNYDLLILATGSHTKGDTPFKGLGSTKATKDALHDFQARVEKAKTIVVAGAGVTGVEMAGELGFECEKKNIILVGSGPTILETQDSPESVPNIAMTALKKLGVDVKLQTKVIKSVPTADGRLELSLSSGGGIEKLIADMYIPTFGLVPNSSYVPSKYLNANGFVMVDEFLQVKGAKDVFAIGDVSDAEYSQFVFCDWQSAHVAKNITLLLKNKSQVPYKQSTKRFMGLQIGRNTATGHWGTMKIPSFIVVYMRKNLFIENLERTVNGSQF